MVNRVARGLFFGQNDVQPALHIPTVYEDIASAPPNWEYHVLSVDTREEELPVAERLNELGAQGWLLAGVLEPGARSGRAYYYFVRQKAA